MSKRRHNFGTKRCKEKSLFIFHARIALKNLQVGRIVRLGFDGAATFSGRRTGVQARIKKHTPHALFVHCHCHLLHCRTCVLLGDNPASFPYLRARARVVSRMNGTDIRMSCSPQPLIAIPC